jgi:hypothetical protein
MPRAGAAESDEDFVVEAGKTPRGIHDKNGTFIDLIRTWLSQSAYSKAEIIAKLRTQYKNTSANHSPQAWRNWLDRCDEDCTQCRWNVVVAEALPLRTSRTKQQRERDDAAFESDGSDEGPQP